MGVDVLLQGRAHPGSKAKYLTPAGAPEKLLMDSRELYDLFLEDEKSAPEFKVACIGALGVPCKGTVVLPSQS